MELREINARIKKLKDAQEEKRANGEGCEKCDWTGMITTAPSGALASVLKEITYPCDCVMQPELAEIDELEKQAERAREKAEHKARLVSLIKKRVGEKYAEKTIEQFRWCDESVKNFFETWIATRQRRTVFISGESGTGKTHLLTCMMRAALFSGGDTYFIRGSDVCSWTRYELVPAEKMQARVERASTCGVLFWDDISKSKLTPALYSNVIYPILDYRRSNGLPTVYTSDELLGDLWRGYDDTGDIDALYNRIREGAEFIFLEGKNG